MKKGKAARIDADTTEHITLAHPVIVVQLALLFNILHSVVPDDFGRGIVIPLLKNPDGNQFTTDSYTGISLSPVIDKLFPPYYVIVVVCLPVCLLSTLRKNF